MSNSDIALKSSLRLKNRIFTRTLCFLFGRGKPMDLHQGNKLEFGLLQKQDVEMYYRNE